MTSVPKVFTITYMMRHLQTYYDRLSAHRYGVTFAAYIAAAFVTGLVCVAFMRAFAFADAHRLSYANIGWWSVIVSPALFLLAVWLVARFGPYAAGSGIPQAICIVRNSDKPEFSSMITAMSSPQTMAVKTCSILLGVWAGASVGREGPSVQIAVCTMFLCITLLAKILPVTVNPRSMALAGGAAGLAAAFNTPLAGVTFAIEELSGGYFDNIKDYVLMAIIIAALAAKAVTGDYIYFGKLPNPPDVKISALVIISIVAGLGGYLFSWSILQGVKVYGAFCKKFPKHLFPILCALAVLFLAWAGGPAVQGPGNSAAQEYLNHGTAGEHVVFPATKLAATVATYWSGVAGGLFAPSLAIGSGIGAELAGLLHYPVSSCALIGMSAFLSGALLAPITAFVIIFELTGHHSMLLPIMLAALIAYITAKSLGAKNLYRTLAMRYENPQDKP